jgi:hypothetical protein
MKSVQHKFLEFIYLNHDIPSRNVRNAERRGSSVVRTKGQHGVLAARGVVVTEFD